MTDTRQVRIVVVDDHAIFREGLRAFLSRVDAFEIVGEAASTDEAVALVAATVPDVVLMDLHLPGAGGIVATREIISAGTAKAVVVLTMHADSAHVQQALEAGARGYLLKDAQGSAIVRSVLAAAEGQVVLDAEIASQLLAPGGTSLPPRAFPELTPREFEVLDRIARGLRNDAIAARLGITMKTVQNTVSVIFLKLGVADRAEAVARARDEGMGAPR